MLKLYRYRYSRLTPNDAARYARPGAITQRTCFFQDRATLSAMLDQWTQRDRDGWRYFESDSDKIYNEGLDVSEVNETSSVDLRGAEAWISPRKMVLVRQVRV